MKKYSFESGLTMGDNDSDADGFPRIAEMIENRQRIEMMIPKLKEQERLLFDCYNSVLSLKKDVSRKVEGEYFQLKLNDWQSITENQINYDLKGQLQQINMALDLKYDRKDLEAKLLCKADKSRMREAEEQLVNLDHYVNGPFMKTITDKINSKVSHAQLQEILE